MQQTEAIVIYEKILHITGDMLVAARNADWDQLIALESECRSLVEQLKPREQAAPLNDNHRRRKVEIIHGILANDAEIRERIHPWMAQLQRYLGSAGRTQQLNAAYQGNL